MAAAEVPSSQAASLVKAANAWTQKTANFLKPDFCELQLQKVAAEQASATPDTRTLHIHPAWVEERKSGRMEGWRDGTQPKGKRSNADKNGK